MKFEIPTYAKSIAKKSLTLRATLPKSKKFGLTRLEAKRKGLPSSVEMARKIVSNKYISIDEARHIVSMYKRFKSVKTDKSEGVIGLRGGKRFAISLNSKI